LQNTQDSLLTNEYYTFEAIGPQNGLVASFFEKILEARAHFVSRKQPIKGVFQGAKFRDWEVDNIKMM